MTKSMTKGSPLKLMLVFMLPLLFGNIFQQTYNIVDAAIVGQNLGKNALASVGATSSVLFFVIGFCSGLTAGCSVPVAQRFGAGDIKSMKDYVFQGFLISAFFSITVTVLTTLLCHPILHLLSVNSKIYDDAYKYLFVIFLGVPFVIFYNYFAGILRAVGDSKTPFIALVVSTIVNIGLDLYFINGIKLGCFGAALATIISQGISVIILLVYILLKMKLLHPERENREVNKKKLLISLGIGLPMGLQFSITAIGSMVMQSSNNGLGTLYSSAFTSAMKIKAFAMCPFDALAAAVATYVGQNYGAGLIDRVKKGIMQAMYIGFTYGLLIGVFLIFFGKPLNLIFISKKDVEVIDAAGQYLRCLGFFFWALGILNVFRMAVQSLGYTGRALVSGVLEMIARIIASTVFVPIYKFDAICFTDQTAWVTGAVYISIITFITFKSISKNELDRKGSHV
ncbi:MATE family efflux transporter [Eubacterium sp.]|uniref:MATE family efflux transporter n=1 Tax=Eubacterium sp. TaxID=142586 RepID=UPI0025DC40B2|nr:MATE family efflux transporter [Eubacterium sp.]MCR5630317.1 MATE family efflux transporter [Eubacterium sp.]